MERPTGSGQFAGGWWLLFAAVICLAIALNIKVDTYPSIDADALALRGAIFTLTGSCIGIAFLLFVTGWIIQAISFLPGKRDIIYTRERALLISDERQGSIEQTDNAETAQTDNDQPETYDESDQPDRFNTFLWIATGVLIIGIIVAVGSYLSTLNSTVPGVGNGTFNISDEGNAVSEATEVR